MNWTALLFWPRRLHFEKDRFCPGSGPTSTISTAIFRSSWFQSRRMANPIPRCYPTKLWKPSRSSPATVLLRNSPRESFDSAGYAAGFSSIGTSL